MANLRNLALWAVAVLLAAPGAAQTVSQRCADAVRAEVADVSSVWVVAALTRSDHMELRWQSANGREGVCRLEPDGRVSDVAVTGVRERRHEQLQPVEESSFEPYEVTCGSEFGGRVECDVRSPSTVVFVEQLGEESCIPDLTWGHDEDVIWVDQGCSATFLVSPVRQRLAPESLSAVRQDARSGGGGPNHPTFRETRAREQCRNLAASRGARVRRILGSRIEGDAVIVLMEVETFAARGELTCRYDPATDRALAVR